jgi:hypothetical protein
MLGLDLVESIGNVPASDVEDRSGVERPPVGEQMPLGLGVGAGFLLALGVLQILGGDLAKRDHRLRLGIGHEGSRIGAACGLAEQCLGLPSGLIRRERTMSPKRDESLTTKHPIFKDVGHRAPLSSSAEAGEPCVPNGRPWSKGLHRPKGD